MEAVHRREVVLGEEMRRRLLDTADYSGDHVIGEATSGDEMINDEGKILTPEDASDISKLVNAVMNIDQNGVGSLPISSVIVEEENIIISSIEVVEESDEEEAIELEFERAVEKTHTHTPYCPNCKNRITKVVLRRKKRTRPPVDLLGCFTCFTIFKPSGNCLNPFGFLKSKPKLDVQPSTDVGSTSTNSNASGLNPFNCFGSKSKLESPKVEDQQPSTDVEGTTSNAADWSVCSMFPIFGKRGSDQKTESGKLEREGEEEVKFDDATVIDIAAGTERERPVEINIHERGEIEQPLISGGTHQRSRSLEILKCIVYGGLIESIASLSTVSSAAASDVATLSVVAIGFATLLSGLIVFGCNLVELRNEATPNKKYEEALGRRGHFVFHSTFAILSYLVFGLIAPTTYGFAFRESDNKEYKIIAVAAASIACILLLSIAKAYVSHTKTFGCYVKTTLCYVSMAVAASGVAYAAGDLIGILLDNLGWFQSPQDITPRPLSY